jgi:hypothetical protein
MRRNLGEMSPICHILQWKTTKLLADKHCYSVRGLVQLHKEVAMISVRHLKAH